MRLALGAALAAAVLVPVPGVLAAQTLAGRVVDAAAGRPVGGAAVEAAGPGGARARATADSAGDFALELPRAGEYRLRVSRLGYLPARTAAFPVASYEDLRVELRLSQVALELEPLSIVGREAPRRAERLDAVGFYEREQRGTGAFLNRDDVDRSRAPRLSELLAEIPGVRRMLVDGRAMVSLGRSVNPGVPCPPTVYLDGQPLVAAQLIDEVVHVRSVEGVEVYRSASQLPARFRTRMDGCGVVVLWTRERG